MLVPWGLDTLEGKIVATYRAGDVDQVVVELSIPGADDGAELTTVVLPADAVIAESRSAASLPSPGAWLPELRYEREIAHALDRILEGWEATIRLGTLYGDAGADLVVESARGTLVVEVKVGKAMPERAAELGLRRLERVLHRDPEMKGLLVTAGVLPASLRSRVQPDGLVSRNIGVVRWRGPEDDERLRSVIETLLPPRGSSERRAVPS